jgi:hypothetical protein
MTHTSVVCFQRANREEDELVALKTDFSTFRKISSPHSVGERELASKIRPLGKNSVFYAPAIQQKKSFPRVTPWDSSHRQALERCW